MEKPKSIEDLIFASALEAQKLHRDKDMYEPSKYPHRCSMCGDYPSSYKLKTEYVESLSYETPYMFICEDCFKDLGV
mgnify:CR=1 FL=1